ncbi:hypothetical protein AKO1_007525 [Acrasis kona]|uniref:Uncharacterized protein n=1 Tax=Acrasis kona TaxID=1008807 RepID=A0AAW2YRI9_9EUKA
MAPCSAEECDEYCIERYMADNSRHNYDGCKDACYKKIPTRPLAAGVKWLYSCHKRGYFEYKPQPGSM